MEAIITYLRFAVYFGFLIWVILMIINAAKDSQLGKVRSEMYDLALFEIKHLKNVIIEVGTEQLKQFGDQLSNIADNHIQATLKQTGESIDTVLTKTLNKIDKGPSSK